MHAHFVSQVPLFFARYISPGTNGTWNALVFRFFLTGELLRMRGMFGPSLCLASSVIRARHLDARLPRRSRRLDYMNFYTICIPLHAYGGSKTTAV